MKKITTIAIVGAKKDAIVYSRKLQELLSAGCELYAPESSLADLARPDESLFRFKEGEQRMKDLLSASEGAKFLLVADGIPQLLLYAERFLLESAIVVQGECYLYDIILWLSVPDEGYSVRRDEIIDCNMVECGKHIKLVSCDDYSWLEDIDLV